MKLRADLVEKLDVDQGLVDVPRWFSRYELFIRCAEQKFENDEDFAKECALYLPLFLKGSALLCFEELEEEDRSQYYRCRARLCEFYRIDHSTAFARFCEAKYVLGSGVDSFIAQLRRYLTLLDLPKTSCDSLILEQFLKAIPAQSASELRVLCGKENRPLELASVISTARHLPSLAIEQQPMVGAATSAHFNRFPVKFERKIDQPRFGKGRGKGREGNHYRTPTSQCFLCKGDHLMRECPHVESFRKHIQNSGNDSGPVSSGAPLDH